MRRNFAFLQNSLLGRLLSRPVLFVLSLHFATLLALLIPAEAAETQRRIALIIGNSRYDHVESLANPTNDSKAMRETLEKLGFDVFSGDDLTLAEFNTLLGTFKSAALTADAALVYYSGHGFQLNGRNYLVPKDAVLADEASIARETIRLDTIISDLQSRDRQTLIFLDACRNNPLPISRRGKSEASSGLAPIEGNQNVFVAFATQPNNISRDGPAATMSPFTRAVTKFVTTPGVGISDMMQKVRNEVLLQTLEEQVPWEQSSLTKPFYFNGAPTEAASQAVASLDLGAPAGSDLGTAQRSTNIRDSLNDPLAGSSSNVLVGPDATGGGMAPVIILNGDAPTEVFGAEELVFAVQEQLQRVGCYVGEIDGVWSGASRQALTRYYATKKLKAEVAEPSDWHLKILKDEEGIICKLPKPAAPVVKAPSRASGGKSAGAPRNNAAGPRRNASAAPAAAPGPGKKTISNSRVLGAFR